MALHHRIKRMEATLASRPRPCPLCAGPSVVRILPAPVVSRVGELPWVEDESGDWCRCGRRVVFKIPPPVVARVDKAGDRFGSDWGFDVEPVGIYLRSCGATSDQAMPEHIFGAAFAITLRASAECPRNQRAILQHLQGQVVNYIELLKWWEKRSPLEPGAAKHVLDLVMAQLSEEGLITEARRVPVAGSSLVPAWTLTERGTQQLREADASS